jgi:hypothetical protein
MYAKEHQDASELRAELNRLRAENDRFREAGTGAHPLAPEGAGMIINVSRLKDHLTCPQYAHNRYVSRRGVAPSLALNVGTLWHLGMAVHLDESHKPAFLEALEFADDVTARAFDALVPAYNAWQLPPDWEIHAIEGERRAPLGPHTLVGTPDAVIRTNGKFWHLQHKTLAPGIPPATYGELIRVDWHECAYQWMLQHDFSPYGGTILNICRKLSAKAIRAEPARALSLQYLTRSSDIIDRALNDILATAHDLDRIVVPLRNRAACGGPYRNSLCPYFGVCAGTETLNADKFVDLEDRYA